MKSTITKTQTKISTTFKVHEDCNYLVIIRKLGSQYYREEVISCDDFKKLGKLMWEGYSGHVTVNDKICHIDEIRFIEPLIKPGKVLSIEDTEQERFTKFRIQYLNDRFGENWKMSNIRKDEKLCKEIQKAFQRA